MNICLALKKVSESIDRNINNQMRDFNLTYSQCKVLKFLHDNVDKKITQRDVEKFLGVSHATVSGIINRLVINEFIIVLVDENDKRAKNLKLTKKEKLLHNRATQINMELENLISSSLDANEIKLLMDILTKIYKKLN